MATNGISAARATFILPTCPPTVKALVVLLRDIDDTSFSLIGGCWWMCNMAVLKRVRAEASVLPEPEVKLP